MRINKFVAGATGLSRRAADEAIRTGRVKIGRRAAEPGGSVTGTDQVYLDGQSLKLSAKTTLMLNKPVGYVCSRNGQGSSTIYDLLPAQYHDLKPAGRLDKNSSGLIILTNDGGLAQRLTHPSHAKLKIYEIRLDRRLQPPHRQAINDRGVQLEDGLSRLSLTKLDEAGRQWQVKMREGRNRQIRRTFAALGYRVESLQRLTFGPYRLGDLPPGQFRLQ